MLIVDWFGDGGKVQREKTDGALTRGGQHRSSRERGRIPIREAGYNTRKEDQ
jgi:hypothetical protein